MDPSRLDLRHVVIADYRLSTIMEVIPDDEQTNEECTITTFDKSLNLISNLLAEMWAPHADSYTSYLGVQSIAVEPTKSFYAFKTFSSDDVEWTVFFDTETRLPRYAVSESFNGKNPSQTVVIKSYLPRTKFDETEFMPQNCFD
jgi:hypothetical protein